MATHLCEYLDYYQSLANPGYAILVTGEWGVGKTYQVRACIQDKDYYYISLFGVRTQEEAHAAIYAACAPTLDSLAKILGTTGDALGKTGGLLALGSAATSWASAAIKKQIKSDRTLIFDDIERCRMELEEMMGVFSTYVEHVGCRVILIADEEKLGNKYPGFKESKEKIVGHTIKVDPLISEAFGAFIALAGDSSRPHIEKHKEWILDVFATSGCKSLRILRHTISDLSRLYERLDESHLEHIKALREINPLKLSISHFSKVSVSCACEVFSLAVVA